jgi:hypothetical protein
VVGVGLGLVWGEGKGNVKGAQLKLAATESTPEHTGGVTSSAGCGRASGLGPRIFPT